MTAPLTIAPRALALVALVQPPPEAARPATQVQGARFLPIVIVLVVVVVLALWIGRRALRTAGISGRARSTTAAEREAAFLAMTLALHEAAKKKGARPTGELGLAEASTLPAPPAPSTFQGQVFCPACGAGLGPSGPMLRFVTRCPGCARRLTARTDGPRISVDVDVDVDG